MFKLLSRLPWRRRRRAPRRPAPLRSRIEGDEDRPLGCGWFDSSHELEQGLQVQEADDQALSTLALADWLALELSGMDAQAAAA